MVSVMQIPNEVLDEIPNIEKQKPHFKLLLQMNALVME